MVHELSTCLEHDINQWESRDARRRRRLPEPSPLSCEFRKELSRGESSSKYIPIATKVNADKTFFIHANFASDFAVQIFAYK